MSYTFNLQGLRGAALNFAWAYVRIIVSQRLVDQLSNYHLQSIISLRPGNQLP